MKIKTAEEKCNKMALAYRLQSVTVLGLGLGSWEYEYEYLLDKNTLH